MPAVASWCHDLFTFVISVTTSLQHLTRHTHTHDLHYRPVTKYRQQNWSYYTIQICGYMFQPATWLYSDRLNT